MMMLKAKYVYGLILLLVLIVFALPRATWGQEAKSLKQVQKEGSPRLSSTKASLKVKKTPGLNCRQIRQINVASVRLISQKTLRRTVEKHENKCLTTEDIDVILKEVTSLYLLEGYIAARVFVKEQSLADGVLDLVAVEGKLESIVMDGRDMLQIKTAFPGLLKKPVNLKDIEQGLAQLNRLRSNNATMSISPGSLGGMSKVLVSRNQRGKIWSGNVSVNNTAASSSGGYSFQAGFNMEDIFSLNDQWGFSYSRKMKEHPLNFKSDPSNASYSGNVSIPYGYWTFKLDGSHGDEDTFLASVIDRKLILTNLSRSLGFEVSRLLERGVGTETSMTARLYWKRTQTYIENQFISVSSRDLTIARLSISHARPFLSGRLSAGLDYEQGLKLFDAFDDDKAQPGSVTGGQFKKVGWRLGYLRSFRLSNELISLQSEASGQFSKDSLFFSESLSYGGNSTVRGVLSSVLSGINGFMVRNDVTWITRPFYKDFNLEPYVAVDYGFIKEQKKRGIKGGHLSGGSIGVKFRKSGFFLGVSFSRILGGSSSVLKQRKASEIDGIWEAKASMAF